MYWILKISHWFMYTCQLDSTWQKINSAMAWGTNGPPKCGDTMQGVRRIWLWETSTTWYMRRPSKIQHEHTWTLLSILQSPTHTVPSSFASQRINEIENPHRAPNQPFFFRLTTRNGPPWCVCVPVKLPDAWVSLQIHEPLNYPKCHFSLARTNVRWHDLLIQFGSFWWVDNPWLTLCGSNMYKRQLSWPRCQVTGTPLALTLGQTMEILVDYHDGDPGDPPKNSIRWYYCGWKKSCTSWQVVCSIIYRVLTIQGGAGFLPSTVVTKTSS